MNTTVDIGLLWNEQTITGELSGGHAVQCRTDCCRYINLAHTTGRFDARAVLSARDQRFALRLGEMFTLKRAEQALAPLCKARPDLDGDLLEAGKTWEAGTRVFDNRVWWPIVKGDSFEEIEKLAAELRDLPGLDPLAFTIVPLDQAVPSAQFEFSLGDFSARVLEVRIVPLDTSALFRLDNVPIGRGFHWQRKEALEYRGILSLFDSGRGLTAVNRLPLEIYLESTVGSEMRSDLPPAFSQAQAICARSTVLATARRHHRADGFDLCNDDHCQCYQGTQRESGATVAPVRETAGQVLAYENRIVDARYAKSCGGLSERYQAVWGGEGPDYFAVRPCGDFALADLTDENAARNFLENAQPAWCNPEQHPYPDPWDKDPLFRWQFRFSPLKLGFLIEEKTGFSVGTIKELRPIRRGESGRILILDIVGSERTHRIYGELNIRRALSPSHLPSSFFVTEQRADEIMLIGGGWGHGVGLCQLGACAMAKAGFPLQMILTWYYPNTYLMIRSDC